MSGPRRDVWVPLLPALGIFTVLFVAPIAVFLMISFWSVRARVMRPDVTLANYVETFTDYGGVLATTIATALVIALATTCLAFGFAYAIRFKLGRLANLFLLAALVTLFGGYLVKVYAWKSILGIDGVLNKALLGLGVIDAPLDALLYSLNGVVVTLVYFLLPFAILPIYGNLRAIQDVTLEAARDVGAGPFAAFRDVVVPQCESGILTAFALCFLISVGDYVTPRFVGGGSALMGTFIENQFSVGFNWPLGSAMAFSTLGCSLAVVLAAHLLLRRMVRR